MKRSGLGVVAALLLFSASAAPAETPTEEKHAAVMRIIELTGGGDMGRQIGAGVFAQIRPVFPDVPGEVWAEVMEVFDSQELDALVAPVYDRNLGLPELQALIAFYETPEGRLILEKLPVVGQESLAVQQQWTQQKMQSVVDQLRDRGYEPKAPEPSAAP